MRVFKFRAFDKLKNKMISTGFHVIGETTMFGQIENYYFNMREEQGKPTLELLNNCVVMQFTGFKDKNGNDVYEGDVVEFEKKNHEIKYFSDWGMFGMVGKNRYCSENNIDEEKPMGSTGSSTPYKPYILNEYYQKRIVVVGNIYEHPELLTH